MTVPGVSAQSRQNYAQDLQLSVRGFGARSSFGVRGVRLYSDGIPGTMPDGQGQFSQFDLSSRDHIEVLRGPFSALYGNSSGGVIAIFTEDAKPGYLARRTSRVRHVQHAALRAEDHGRQRSRQLCRRRLALPNRWLSRALPTRSAISSTPKLTLDPSDSSKLTIVGECHADTLCAGSFGAHARAGRGGSDARRA